MWSDDQHEWRCGDAPSPEPIPEARTIGIAPPVAVSHRLHRFALGLGDPAEGQGRETTPRAPSTSSVLSRCRVLGGRSLIRRGVGRSGVSYLRREELTPCARTNASPAMAQASPNRPSFAAYSASMAPACTPAVLASARVRAASAKPRAAIGSTSRVLHCVPNARCAKSSPRVPLDPWLPSAHRVRSSPSFSGLSNGFPSSRTVRRASWPAGQGGKRPRIAATSAGGREGRTVSGVKERPLPTRQPATSVAGRTQMPLSVSGVRSARRRGCSSPAEVLRNSAASAISSSWMRSCSSSVPETISLRVSEWVVRGLWLSSNLPLLFRAHGAFGTDRGTPSAQAGCTREWSRALQLEPGYVSCRVCKLTHRRHSAQEDDCRAPFCREGVDGSVLAGVDICPLFLSFPYFLPPL